MAHLIITWKCKDDIIQNKFQFLSMILKKEVFHASESWNCKSKHIKKKFLWNILCVQLDIKNLSLFIVFNCYCLTNNAAHFSMNPNKNIIPWMQDCKFNFYLLLISRLIFPLTKSLFAFTFPCISHYNI